MFSKSCEYGIKAVVYIAQQSLNNKRVKLNKIAKEIESPSAFTAKVLQLLAKENIIKSVMGKHGGYEINKAQLDKITLLDIVTIIDGDQIYSGCGLGFKECNEENPCLIHYDFVKTRKHLKQMLLKTTVLALTTNLDNGLVHIKSNFSLN